MSYSPALALATAAFELGAALWALTAPRDRATVRLSIALLLVLAGYQLLELFVCRAEDPSLAGRLAFVDVVRKPCPRGHSRSTSLTSTTCSSRYAIFHLGLNAHGGR